MSKNVVKLVIALSFLSLLFVASGQNRLIATQDRSVSAPQEQAAPAVLVPQINKYGSLVGLKDTTGKDLLKEIRHRWREGYAIAYQVKNSKGAYADRFVYVMGDKVSARKLKVERRKSTTSRKVVSTGEKALEIMRVIAWDEKSRALKSVITITNTSNRKVALKSIEIDIDKNVLAHLLNGVVLVPNPRDIIVDPPCPYFARIRVPGSIASADVSVPTGADCDGCPPCPCEKPRCYPDPGQALSFDRDSWNRTPIDPGDLIGSRLPQFKAPMRCLSWAGSNLTPSVLGPGEQVAVHYGVIIPQPKARVP